MIADNSGELSPCFLVSITAEVGDGGAGKTGRRFFAIGRRRLYRLRKLRIGGLDPSFERRRRAARGAEYVAKRRH
jgi:hypothetical protein